MKSYGTMEGVYINGAPQGITFHETDNFTLYPASILSVNKNRFTKHYFIGDKRIASRPNTTPNTNPGPPVSWNDPSNPDDPQAGYGYIPNDTTKEETFFYHSDHLGSTSYRLVLLWCKVHESYGKYLVWSGSVGGEVYNYWWICLYT